jgi:cytochrome c oxidase assembly protein subunit 15
MMQRFHRLAVLSAIVALCVIVLGAWVRLSHAGLGCPDWPGCYGVLTWPDAPAEISRANRAFPERPVEVDKAWKEMVHRYLAGALVLLVLLLNWRAWRGGHETAHLRAAAGVVGALILFQAALGMWTVTLKLKPVIVMAHLLGGMTTFALLCWLACRSATSTLAAPPHLRGWVLAGTAILFAQIALGGWTSANYAALACPDLPTCTGQWWPTMDFDEAFVLWREVGVDYEGGILDQSARAAIHLSHRVGAVLTLAVMLALGLWLRSFAKLRGPATVLLGLISLQFVLGLLNVYLQLPLPNAVAHNGVAALVLACLIFLLSRTTPRTLQRRRLGVEL